MLLRISLFLCAIVTALAQDTATLTGTVTDSSGAVVVGAQVTATNIDTNCDSATSSNSEGFYRTTATAGGQGLMNITLSFRF